MEGTESLEVLEEDIQVLFAQIFAVMIEVLWYVISHLQFVGGEGGKGCSWVLPAPIHSSIQTFQRTPSRISVSFSWPEGNRRILDPGFCSHSKLLFYLSSHNSSFSSKSHGIVGNRVVTRQNADPESKVQSLNALCHQSS